jgi:hypothetical protein
MLAAQAMADGKFYSDRIPPGIPYQRAILIFDGKKETLTIESKFEAKEGERFAWVVPVPALPEFASPNPMEMDFRYSALERRTKPITIDVIPTGILLLLAAAIVYLLYRRRWPAAIATVVITGVAALVASPSYMSIDVLKEERVGPYEVKVIRGTSSAEVVAWLSENGFRFEDGDRKAFDGYVSRGWVFVAAKLDTGAKGARGLMVPPLSLIFPTRQVVYPLALTATAGQPVEILLYVNAPWRADVGDRLPLLYSEDSGGGYLTKFRGVMTPEQMREDMVIKRAQSNSSYRKWEFKF